MCYVCESPLKDRSIERCVSFSLNMSFSGFKKLLLISTSACAAHLDKIRLYLMILELLI